MKDKRLNKVKQHFDILINDQKFKVISCKIDEAGSILSIKTKIFGQDFPHNGCFTIAIPSQDTMQDLSVVFRSMSKDSSIEHWEYTIKTEQIAHLFAFLSSPYAPFNSSFANKNESYDTIGIATFVFFFFFKPCGIMASDIMA